MVGDGRGAAEEIDALDALVRRQDRMTALAEDLGMPVFVKAAHGGGGRGMRLVTDLADLEEAVGASRREDESAARKSSKVSYPALVHQYCWSCRCR